MVSRPQHRFSDQPLRFSDDFFSFESLGHYNFFYHQMHVLFFVIILIISRFLPTVPFQVWSPEADEEQEQQ